MVKWGEPAGMAASIVRIEIGNAAAGRITRDRWATISGVTDPLGSGLRM